ncbi:hypothetical protein LCGC14_0817480 [marine sediment metagenome]|uniref:Uncharacterized protein n=1 Tax=marine sediment metagenome TaxID=412755 RepID=A0A0F9SSB5_9ZZZZ
MSKKRECAWCGAGEPDISYGNPHWYPNRRGEWFCNPSHRGSSNRALKRFIDRVERVDTQATSGGLIISFPRRCKVLRYRTTGRSK